MAGKILKALSLLLLISSPAIGQTIPASYFGMHENHAAAGGSPYPTVAFGTFRIWDVDAVAWSSLEPSRGMYNWTALDNWINTLNSRGVTDIIYTFGYTPAWAASQICLPPSNHQDLIDFATAIVTRYQTKIKHWEAWNEVTSSTFWCGGTMSQLVQVQNDVYTTVKSIDPTATVHTPVTGVSATSGDCSNSGAGSFSLNNFLAANGTSNFDVVDLHFYPYPAGAAPETTSVQSDNGRCAMSTYGISSKPLWNTEFGWGLNGYLPGTSDQVAFLARSYLYWWSKGIPRSYWYAYDNSAWGTLWNNGANSLTQAGVAYQQLYTWMVGATMTTPCALAGNVWSCEFTLANGNHGRAVWLDVFQSSATQSYTPGGTFNNYLDLVGGTTNFSNSVTISEQPILLEGTVSARPNAPTALTATVH